MNPLIEEIHDSIPWILNELRFRIVQDSYAPEAFGNCVVVLNGPQFRLRLVRDRGQILADLAPLIDPEKWWNLVFLLEVIHGKMPEPEFGLVAVAYRVRDNLLALVEAMGPRWTETRRELERRSQLRLRALRDPGRLNNESKPTWLQRIFRG